MRKGTLTADLKEPEGDQTVWIIAENIFCVVWLSEMLARLYVHRLRYFMSGWNILDFALALCVYVEPFGSLVS